MKEKEIKALISLLDDEDIEILNHVETKLYTLGSDAVPLLEDAWESHFNPTIQKRIEDIIHTIQYEKLLDGLKEWKEEEEHDLLKGMWLVACFIYPDLDYNKIIKEIEQLYYDIWVEFKYEMHPFDQVKVFNSVFFQKQNFRPNTKNFHAPNNSMINIVLESKKGNPITLSVLYLLIAQKMKLPIYGVNLPNQFILTYKTDDMQFYISPFNKGLTFNRADIDNYVGQLNLSPAPAFYEPCTTLEIITRVLRNLVVSYEKIGDSQKAEDLRRLLKVFD